MASYEMVVAVVLFALTLLLIFYYPSFERRTKRLPPGPYPLPVIGCLHRLGKEPHRALASLSHRYGPVMTLRLGTKDILIVSSTEAAKLILKTHDATFASKPAMAVGRNLFYDSQDVSFAAYGDHWKKMRKICVNELLSPKSMESFREVREQHVSAMMRNLWADSRQGNTRVDLSDAVFNVLYEMIWATIARKTVSVMSKELLHLPRQMVEMFMGGLLYDLFPYLEVLEPLIGIKRRMITAWKSFDTFADNVLSEHAVAEVAEEEKMSFVDLLLHISKEDPFFTTDKIKALMLNMFLGGTDTSATTIEWMVSNLLRKPECLRQAEKEVDDIVKASKHPTFNESHVGKLKYLRWALKETLRVNPAGAFLPPHEAAENITIDGYNVPKGSWVMVNVWAIGMDSKVWEDAQEFKPERHAHADEEDSDMSGQTDFKSLPFGAGRRGCPGHNMAFQVILLIVGTLLHSFHLSVEGDPTELDMTVKVSAALSRQNHLYVLPKVRNVNYAHLLS